MKGRFKSMKNNDGQGCIGCFLVLLGSVIAYFIFIAVTKFLWNLI